MSTRNSKKDYVMSNSNVLSMEQARQHKLAVRAFKRARAIEELFVDELKTPSNYFELGTDLLACSVEFVFLSYSVAKEAQQAKLKEIVTMLFYQAFIEVRERLKNFGK